jgi:hypothetical protein
MRHWSVIADTLQAGDVFDCCVVRTGATKDQGAAMHVMLDESRPGDGSRTFMAAIVANEAGWQSLSDRWTSLLLSKDMRFLHTSDFLSANGDHRNLQPDLRNDYDARIAVLRELGSLIPHCAMAAIIVGVDATPLKSALADEKGGVSADLFAFQRSVVLIHDSMAAGEVAEPVTLCVDDNPATAMRMYGLWRRAKKKHSWARQFMHSICFSDDKHLPPLQAADLVATIVLREYARGKDAWGADSPFKGILPLHPEGGYNVCSEYWDEEAILAHIETVRATAV